jgi:hypothetical protein
MKQQSIFFWFIWQTAELPLESVILLLGGMAPTVVGGLLLAFSAGMLPYYAEGLWGLLLVVYSLQIISLGKTPFGELRRSRRLIGFGLVVSCIGISTACIPGLFGPLPRLLLAACFGLGGTVQFIQIYRDETRLRFWLKIGGDLRRLAWACASVYSLSALTGLLLWLDPPIPTPVSAILLLLFGAAVINLSTVLRRVYHAYPAADSALAAKSGLSFDHCMLLFTGVFMVLLGLLLVPVSLGLLPFAANAQLGLLMTIFALQMLASGNTPIGPFSRRSWFMVSLGLLFALPGIVSCVIPQLLVTPLTALVGVLNLLGGLLPLGARIFKIFGPSVESAAHPLLEKLSRTQLLLNLLSILFGSSMLFPGILPALATGLILALNGCVLLYLLHLLLSIANLSAK